MSQEQIWIPDLEQHWKLQLGLAVPLASGAADELPGSLVWHPLQVGFGCTTQRALKLVTVPSKPIHNVWHC